MLQTIWKLTPHVFHLFNAELHPNSIGKSCLNAFQVNELLVLWLPKHFFFGQLRHWQHVKVFLPGHWMREVHYLWISRLLKWNMAHFTLSVFSIFPPHNWVIAKFRMMYQKLYYHAFWAWAGMQQVKSTSTLQWTIDLAYNQVSIKTVIRWPTCIRRFYTLSSDDCN